MAAVTESVAGIEPVDPNDDAIERLFGKGKKCLAPMVRAGTLPLRLLSLYHGADTLYSEEIIDFKLLEGKVEFNFNEELGIKELITWKKDKSRVTYQTCKLEEGRNVFQLGSSNGVRALKAAQHVAPHVAAIDLNMGCPKHFSIHAGMGAALLQTPEVAEDIIKTLRRNLNVPITCKIRLLETEQDTIQFAQRMEKAGAQAIGVHTRRREDRPRHRAHWDALSPVVDAVSIPVIANGDIYSLQDADNIIAQSGCSSVMFARGALWNPAVFGKHGRVEQVELCKQYMRIAAVTNNHYANTKYSVLRILQRDSDNKDTRVAPHKNPESLYKEFGLQSFWDQRETYRPLKDCFDYLFEDPCVPEASLEVSNRRSLDSVDDLGSAKRTKLD